jgi:GT2 family glycosyltransferase
MSRASAKILVIIVTWNKKEFVINLLHSLSDITYATENLDILVVDNASNDGTVIELEKLFPFVTIIRNTENLGGTGGFNSGLAWAFSKPDGLYDYLWLLDNDVVVHKNALAELVNTLEQNPDAAVAGSTMLQLDYPWQINEMGAMVNRDRGTLLLNRHLDQVPGWHEKSLAELLTHEADLTRLLSDCHPTMDVDYVAAASLLIRAPVAKQAGLWMDFFIHFDDVEWCLRISAMGNRIMVSANSLIWHLSAVAKIPTWILYYNSRNVLYVLGKHSNIQAVKGTISLIAKRALFYALLGKPDLAQLHLDGIADYKRNITGKKTISFHDETKSLDELDELIFNPETKRILIPSSVDIKMTGIQSKLERAIQKRNDLVVHHLHLPSMFRNDYAFDQISGATPIFISKWTILRSFQYLSLYNQYDVVFQSEYYKILPLSWSGRKVVFINYENYCLRFKPTFKSIVKFIPKILPHFFLFINNRS